MWQDPKLKETFPFPPLIAYKVAPNLRSNLVRAKGVWWQIHEVVLLDVYYNDLERYIL